ncbi:MAG TPA: Ig-like domain-containing protein, partial [Planctomycetota bacterium]|nr:Ig-like domain-containing protein [Planctomycetota bacterium]
KGRTTVVLFNDLKDSKRQDVVVSAVPAGRYGVSRTVNRRPSEELGTHEVGPDGKLTLQVDRGTVLTVYPHPGGNLPPVVTGFDARPTFLTAPASSVTLTASATDPERDDVRFAWSVTSQPGGAKAALARPDAAATPATGLTVPGEYVFTVVASDATHDVPRRVKVIVFAANQPPEIFDLHNRIPITVTLPDTQTHLRAWPNDLEKDKLTWQWKVMKQPAGADARLELPPRAKPTDTARLASNMTVAGDYVFRFEVNDGKNTVFRDHTVTVHAENHAPTITEAGVDALMKLGENSVGLAAKASDPDGDTITFWWSTKKAPAGVKPVFASPGQAKTSVTGLTVAGDYVFTVAVIDRTKAARRDVKLTVGP